MKSKTTTAATANVAEQESFASLSDAHKVFLSVMLLILIAFVSPAKADNVQVASAVQVVPQIAAPTGIFGTQEIKSNNISNFKKWTSVMSRFKQELASGKAAGMKTWNTFLASMQDKSRAEKIKGVNDFFNAIRYVEDIDNYGKTDYWATPLEFISRGKGDCEDYAIAKYAALEALGFGMDELRIAVVQDQIKRVPHALLVVYDQGGEIILDNQNKSLKAAKDINRYKVMFTINEQNWWLHRPVRTA